MSAEARSVKLKNVVSTILQLNHFSYSVAKDACRSVSPAYVTRTVKSLVKDGYLVSSSDEQNPTLSWVSSKQPDDFDAWISNQVYGDQVKLTPIEDRPRERLLRDGPESLSYADLLAILIRVGTVGESAVQAGRRIANRYGEHIERIVDGSLSELRSISPAIRKDSYAQVMAGIELGRRIASKRDQNHVPPVRIRGSDDAITYCARAFARLATDGLQEQFHIVTLDTQYGPINNHLITIGTLDASLVHPREVFKFAIRDSASAIILVHNHPSGDPTPSKEDLNVTKRLEEVGTIVGIRVLDHIIVAREQCISIMAMR
jgi:DNA repair protein RadC